jgi:hypothetical protein
MISFALILMTLPSRVAGVRAGRAVRGGLPDSSREGSGCSGVRRGERLDNSSSAARDGAATTKER